jgi:hypothetical protein
MADGKRLSTTAKVAVPRVGGQAGGATLELDAALAKAIGARIRITTSIPDHTFEGVLFTVCPVTNLVAVSTTSAPPNTSTTLPAGQPSDYRIVPVSQIQNFSILSFPSGQNDKLIDGTGGRIGGDADFSIARLDLDALKRKEEDAVKKLKEKDALRGKGVGKEAQDIFDHINRQLPSRWHETDIVVNDAVVISAPYGLENCKAPKDKGASLVRVKKILEGFYARKKPQTATSTAATGPAAGRVPVATPVPPRKGG